MNQQLKFGKHQEFFFVPRLTFAALGIDPLACNKGIIIRHPVICFGHYILTFLFAVASIDFCFNNTDDMNEFTLTISVLNQLIIALWKFGFYLNRRQRVNRVITNIWQWNVKANEEDMEIINRFSSKTALINKLYCLSVGMTGVIGLSRPFIAKLFKMLRGVESELEIPHKVTFLWDTTTPLGYLISYIWNVITINFLFSASVAIDTLFLWLVTNILIRFEILNKRFIKLAKQNFKCLNHTLIRENIHLHCVVLDLVHELNELFSEVLFLQSLVSCTQICFLVYRLMSKNVNLISLNYTILFLAAVSMQLFFYCYSGEWIKAQSLSVCDTIFNNFEWSQISVRYQKNLQIIIRRSQKSCNMRGIFFSLNLELYLWFFKTAASLIAVLKTLEDSP